MKSYFLSYVWIAAFAAANLPAADTAERTTVTLNDPSRPATIAVELMNGNIEVKGYAGKDIEVEVRGGASLRGGHLPDHAGGLKRIDTNSAALTIDQAANVVSIRPRPWDSVSLVALQAPFGSSLKLKPLNGDVTVDRVAGDIEVEALNGSVKLTNISGAALVHSIKGKIEAVFERIPETKAESFSSLNGDIDITLPANAKVNLKSRTDNGGVYSDFDVKLQPLSNVSRGEGSRRGTTRLETGTYGTINGGGADLRITTFNGNIYVRKAK